MPLVIMVSRAGMTDTFAVQIVPWIASPLYIFLFYQFFAQLPKELFEAAQIDGASIFRIYRSIFMPLSLPAARHVSILMGIESWNQYLWPILVTQTDYARPIAVAIATFFGQDSIYWDRAMAASVLMMHTDPRPLSCFPALVRQFLRRFRGERLTITHQATAPSFEHAQATISAILPAGTTVAHLAQGLQAETPASSPERGWHRDRRCHDRERRANSRVRTPDDSQGGRDHVRYDPSTTDASPLPIAFQAKCDDRRHPCSAQRPTNAMPELPGSYHFRPPFGWMNDPNGFGRFGENVHLFYQHYPHSRAGTPCIGDMRFPTTFFIGRICRVFLFPPSELSARADGRGGAFSGSAIPLPGEPDGVRVFFTEHVKGRRPEEQIQFTMQIEDMISADAAELILPQRPEGLDLTLDFRDPYVFKGPDGRWKMLLGSRDHAGGVILLYETDDPTGAGGWRFIGILHREDRFGKKAAECPCLVPLDGPPDDPETRWALIFGLLTSRDLATGRHNIAIATVGRFDGRSFEPNSSRSSTSEPTPMLSRLSSIGPDRSASPGSPTGPMCPKTPIFRRQ